MKRWVALCISVLVSVFLHAALSYAQEGRIRVGNLKVVPGISLQGVHDNNIYLGNGTNATTELKQSDWITHLMPGLLLNYTLEGRGSMSLGYRGDYAYYSKTDKNDWKNHSGAFDVNYEAPGGLILGINEGYTTAADPYGADNNYKLGVPRTERWNNDLKTKVGYGMGDRFKVFLFLNNYKQDYKLITDYTQDYESDEIGAGLQMKLLPKTWGFIRYFYGAQDYYTHPAGTGSTEANDADHQWHRVNMGLTWDPDSKLSGEFNVGLQWRTYDNTLDAAGNRYEDNTSWIAATSLNYTATATTTLGLTLSRALRVTGSDSREYFYDTSLGLNLTQLLASKLKLTAGVMYSNNDYNLPVADSRKDDNYNGNVGLEYQIQPWLSAGIGSKYMKKESNYQDNDYTDLQFLFSLKGMY